MLRESSKVPFPPLNSILYTTLVPSLEFYMLFKMGESIQKAFHDAKHFISVSFILYLCYLSVSVKSEWAQFEEDIVLYITSTLVKLHISLKGRLNMNIFIFRVKVLKSARFQLSTLKFSPVDWEELCKKEWSLYLRRQIQDPSWASGAVKI